MFIRWVGVFFILFISVFSFAENRISVVVSIEPAAFVVEAIGSDRIDVVTMVPSDSNPHIYEPSMRDMAKFSQSDYFFSIGGEFEDIWLDRLVSMNKNLKTVKLDRNLPVKLSNNDPHAWMSPANMLQMGRNTYSVLAEILPQHEGYFRNNLTLLKKKIAEIQGNIGNIINKCHYNNILTVHPVLGYFAEEFGLTQLSVERHGQEPSARHLANIVKKVQKYNIRFIFTQPQVSQNYANMLSSETGITVGLIDPLQKDWFSLQEKIHSVLSDYCDR